jgi:hypothetical protein
METELAYYTQHGALSNPGAYAHLFNALPTDLAGLVGVVQATTVHVFWAERYGLKLPPERMPELQLRTLERRLARTLALDARPLTEPRPLDKKLVGNCRDHSLLLTALLRHQGVPARARCGFGAYFMPNHYEDHWVTEYWNQDQRRWVLVDAQLDALQCEAMRIPFNPLDVPRDQFVVGGLAWQMCRTGQADPDTFGIFNMHGLGFVRGNLVRDVAALTKVELLPWDCWGVILKEQLDDAGDLALLDHVAALTAGDPVDWPALRASAADPRLRMDGHLLSYVDGAMTPVEVNV